MASEPVRRPIAVVAAVSPAEAAIDPSATFSLTFIDGPLPEGLMAAAGGVNAPGAACTGRFFAVGALISRQRKHHSRRKRAMDLAIRQLHPLFAAEIRGADLSRDIDPATRHAIEH